MVNYYFNSSDSFNFIKCSLITFIQYYFTQETENAIKEDAKRIGSLVEKSHNKTLAIKIAKHSLMVMDRVASLL